MAIGIAQRSLLGLLDSAVDAAPPSRVCGKNHDRHDVRRGGVSQIGRGRVKANDSVKRVRDLRSRASILVSAAHIFSRPDTASRAASRKRGSTSRRGTLRGQPLQLVHLMVGVTHGGRERVMPGLLRDEAVHLLGDHTV